MAVGPLFFGLLLLLWLGLGTAGWVAVTFLYRPRASFLAWGAALVGAVGGGLLPGLLGWKTFPGLLFGLLLALVCSTTAAWQTMVRIRPGPTASRHDRRGRGAAPKRTRDG